MGVRAESTELNEKHLMAQIGRLKAFHGWENLRHELLKILWRESQSDAHAERITDHVLSELRPNDEGFTACPVPAVFHEYCRCISGTDPAGIRPAKTDCQNCFGSGFVITTRWVRPLNGVGLEPYEATAAAPCPCRRAT